MAIDATRKTRDEETGRYFSSDLKMSENIISIVNKRWKEYGF